jgi:hypothetical protein
MKEINKADYMAMGYTESDFNTREEMVDNPSKVLVFLGRQCWMTDEDAKFFGL